MRTLVNSADPDEMPHNAAFHQDFHCLLRQKRSSEKEIHYFLFFFFVFFFKIITCDPLIYTIDHPNCIVSNQKEESISV